MSTAQNIAPDYLACLIPREVAEKHKDWAEGFFRLVPCGEHAVTLQISDNLDAVTAPGECSECMGEGEIPVNPGYPDPRTLTSVSCGGCGGSGRSEN